MLRIRAEQMELLKAAARQRFEDSLHAYLTATFPTEIKALKLTLPGIRSLTDLIRHGVNRATIYSLQTERDVARFVELLVRVDPMFETRRELAWITTLLRNASMTPHARIELVHELLPRRLPGFGGAVPKPVEA